MAEPEPSHRSLPPRVACPVCDAPALPVDGACVFCGSPLHERSNLADLPEYVASRLPAAVVTRGGLLHRGPIQRVEVTLGETTFRLELHGGWLVFSPDVPAEQWAARMVRALGEAATDDSGLRATLSRAGWVWPS